MGSGAGVEVSVLIPTYDRPQFLAQALRSALTPQISMEVLVGDDGARGEAVVASLDDPRIRYVKRARRFGIAGNWNALLDEAQGEFLALLMDDDRWTGDFLQAVLEVFHKTPDVGVVFTDHWIDRAGRLERRHCAVKGGRHESFTAMFLEHKPVAVSAAVFRRAAWQSARPLPPTAAADMVLFTRIAEDGWPFYYIDRPLMIYRGHDAMYSASLTFRDDCVRAWEAITVQNVDDQRKLNARLAEALLARARGKLQTGRSDGVRADLDRAMTLDPSSARRVRTTLMLSRWPAAARTAARLIAFLRLRRGMLAGMRRPRSPVG